jgi:hypothetical protein
MNDNATNIAKFRRKVGDKVKADKDVATANGNETQWHLRHENVFGVQVFSGADMLTNETDYTIDSEAGVVTLVSAPADGAVVSFLYKFAAFTDDEITSLISEYGLDGAVIEGLREMLADSSKLMNYKQGDTEVEYSVIFKQVKQLLDYYESLSQQALSAADSDTGFAIGQRIHPLYEDGTYKPNDISRFDSIG